MASEQGHWVTLDDGRRVFIKEDLIDKQYREIEKFEKLRKELNENRMDLPPATPQPRRIKRLSAVKVGDTVYQKWSGTRNSHVKPLKVTKITKTQIITDDGNRWLITTGGRIGDQGRVWGGLGNIYTYDGEEVLSDYRRYGTQWVWDDDEKYPI